MAPRWLQEAPRSPDNSSGMAPRSRRRLACASRYLDWTSLSLLLFAVAAVVVDDDVVVVLVLVDDAVAVALAVAVAVSSLPVLFLLLTFGDRKTSKHNENHKQRQKLGKKKAAAKVSHAGIAAAANNTMTEHI